MALTPLAGTRANICYVLLRERVTRGVAPARASRCGFDAAPRHEGSALRVTRFSFRNGTASGISTAGHACVGGPPTR